MSNVTVTINLNDKFSGKFNEMTKAMNKLINKTQNVSNAIDKMVLSIDSAATAIEKLGTKVTTAFNTINKASLSPAVAEVKKLTTQMNHLTDSANKASDANAKVGNTGATAGVGVGANMDLWAPSSLLMPGHPLVAGLALIAAGVFALVVKIKDLIVNVTKFASDKLIKYSSDAIKLSSATEQELISLETLLNTPEEAKAFDKEVVKFTQNSPFELPQMRSMSRQLLASNFSKEETREGMEIIGNVTTGLGTRGKGFEEITGAISRMKVDGKVTEKEMQSLVAARIPAWDILAQKMNRTTTEIKTMTKSGTIPADQAMRHLLDGMKTMHPEAMRQQGQTIEGLFSNLQNLYKRLLENWGDGILQSLQPRLQQLSSWIENNDALIGNWGQMLQNLAYSASNHLLSMFESAFQYVQTQYLNKPEFMNLPLDAKVGFIIDDLTDAFTAWYDNGGYKTIYSITDKILKTLEESVDFLGPRLFDIGVRIGASIYAGLFKGFIRGGINNPDTAAQMIPGASLAAPAVGALKATYDLVSEHTGFDGMAKLKGFWNYLSDLPWDMVNPTALPISSFAGGLDRVPYNGFPAILHKDERVQTKAEADAWRGGEYGPSPIQFTLNYHGERMGESEIDNIMGIFARKLEGIAHG